MWTKLICFCLVSSAFGQIPPTHVIATEDLSDPTHPKVFATFPSTGADEYRVYEALISNGLNCPTLGSTIVNTQVWPDGSIHKAGSPAYVLDTTIPGGVPAFDSMHPFSIDYPDDPYPNLNQVPAAALPNGLGWCYSVSSVVSGVESQLSAPKAVWLGFRAYYAWVFHSACGGPPAPYPLAPQYYKPVLVYRDPSGVNHSFGYFDNKVVINAAGVDEIFFHLPVVANDGTMVPLLDASANGKARYFVELRTPDGYLGVENTLPSQQGDRAYYAEVSTNFLIGGKSSTDNCKAADTPTWWQDTSY